MLCPIPICFNIDTTVIAFLSLYIDPLLCVALYLSLTKDQYPLFLLFHSCIIWIKRWIIDSHLIYHNRQFSPVMSISIHIPMFHIRTCSPFVIITILTWRTAYVASSVVSSSQRLDSCCKVKISWVVVNKSSTNTDSSLLLLESHQPMIDDPSSILLWVEHRYLRTHLG